jgi:hypothetical protein
VNSSDTVRPSASVAVGVSRSERRTRPPALSTSIVDGVELARLSDYRAPHGSGDRRLVEEWGADGLIWSPGVRRARPGGSRAWTLTHDPRYAR